MTGYEQLKLQWKYQIHAGVLNLLRKHLFVVMNSLRMINSLTIHLISFFLLPLITSSLGIDSVWTLYNINNAHIVGAICCSSLGRMSICKDLLPS